jgi:hypothetical protein
MSQQPMEPHEFFADAVNSARKNIAETVRLLENGGGANPTMLLKIAEIQASLAQGVGLAMVAQAIHAGNAPGASIRYGMADIAEAIKNINKPREGV